MKEVTVLYASEVSVRCPHCHENNGGWCGDPRGEETTCDFCEKDFKINEHSDIEFEY